MQILKYVLNDEIGTGVLLLAKDSGREELGIMRTAANQKERGEEQRCG